MNNSHHRKSETMTRPNTLTLLISFSAGLLLASAAQAQVYRSIGPDERATYSDRPPAANARATGVSPSAQSASGGALPYELNQVAQRFPVTLYSGSNCAACDSGRSLLTRRGIPFSEKTVESNSDIEALQRLTGGNQLPAITIGGQRLTGFTDQEWSQYLDAAGYPKTSQLPNSYRRPPATPLVAAKPATASAQEAPPPTRPQSPAPPPPASMAPERTPDNPAGISF
jgi:glutaredoxin